MENRQTVCSYSPIKQCIQSVGEVFLCCFQWKRQVHLPLFPLDTGLSSEHGVFSKTASGFLDGQLETTHYLENIPRTGQKNLPQRRCKICKEKGLRQMSCFYCPQCPKQPAFCRIRDCFVKYHANMGYLYIKPVVPTSADLSLYF